jgi:signal peptide peptidase SppA
MRDAAHFRQLLAGRVLALERCALVAYEATWAADIALPPVTAAARGGGGGGAGPNVAIINISGFIEPHPSLIGLILGGTALSAVRRDVRAAASNPNVDTILLLVNSPGGFIDAVPETAEVIRQAGREKPVVAVVDGLAASAGYWLASQASRMILTPSGDVGSIGVYMSHTSFAGANARLGVERTYISAPVGGYKTEGNTDEPLSSDATAYLQAQVDAIYRDFVADVARGRGIAASRVDATYGQGRVVTARDALARGMVDEIVPTDTALQQVFSGQPNKRRALARSLADEALLASAYATALMIA